MREESPALSRLTVFAELSDGERQHLARVARPPRSFEAKTVIREEGVDASHCYILLEGWVGSFTTFSDGGRSMTKVHMAGDMMGQASLAFLEAAETLVALSPVTLVGITSKAIGSLFHDHPRLAALLYLISQEERVRQTDRMSNLLRLDAAGRIAVLLLNLHDRCHRQQPAVGDEIDFHLTQYDIADLTGLTAVHTNRILQLLRREEAIRLRNHRLTIVDRPRLEQLADRQRRRLRQNPEWLVVADAKTLN